MGSCDCLYSQVKKADPLAPQTADMSQVLSVKLDSPFLLFPNMVTLAVVY